MKDKKTVYGAFVTGDWPSTVAKNASGPNSTDGTPFTAELINDLWGGQIDLMNRAGLTPNGTTEAVGSSQFMDALHYAGLTPGIAVLSMLDAAHLALHRFLPLTGQHILIANYSALCAAVYCGDTDNATADCNYKSSDSDGQVRSTTGTYLTLGDARGLGVRGIGLNGSIFPANHPTNNYSGGTAAVRYLQDQFQGHWHDLYIDATKVGAQISDATSGISWHSITPGSFAGQITAKNLVTDGTNGTPRTGYETRMATLGFQICITY
jgi:hypothetical protein